MASPVLLQEDFRGFQRDKSRDQLPKGVVYDTINMLPDLGAPARKRGGWATIGSSFPTVNGSLGYPRHVVYAPFPAGPQIVAFDDALNHVIDLTNSVDRGAAQEHTQAPIFFAGLLIIGAPLTAGGDTPSFAPMKYSGSGAPAALGGSPPVANNFAVYRSRLLLADNSRIYFSAPFNPESWDTTNAWLETSGPIRGLAALHNAVIIYHDGGAELMLHDTPPSATGTGNLELGPLYEDVGLYSPNAFSVNADRAVWADQSGIYLTDGAAFTDLSKEGGIKDYWRTQAETAGAGAFCAVGHWKGYALISLLDSARGYVDFLVCDTKARSFYRCDNIQAKNFSARSGDTNACYFSNQSTKDAGDLAGIFEPTSVNTVDGNTGSVIPLMDTAYFDLSKKGRKRVRHVYTGYDLRGTNQTLSISYALTPEATSYTATTGTLGVTTKYERKRVSLGKAASGFSLRLTAGFNDDLKLYSLEGELHDQEASRRA